MVSNSKLLAITPGDPAGIGIDIILLAFQLGYLENTVVIADRELLLERAQQLHLNVDIHLYPEQKTKSICVLHTPLNTLVKSGVADSRYAPYVLKTLDTAIEHLLTNEFSALVTGPINKATINEGGFKFAGHTQYFAAKTQSKTIMMFVTPKLKLALMTEHIPLAKVPNAITAQSLTEGIHKINTELKKYFGISNPRIWVCGLNPHAGENGYLGTEEQNIIIPSLQLLKNQGINVQGPISADIAFTPKILEQADVIVAMYHDQGLPVVKAQGFHSAVNVTLGLPFIRTSVDHGTAYDIAGTGKADPMSLIAAIQCARSMVENKL